MNIEDVLKLRHSRLSYGSRWLVFYANQWTVMEHKYNQKKVRTILETNDLSFALNKLIEED